MTEVVRLYNTETGELDAVTRFALSQTETTAKIAAPKKRVADRKVAVSEVVFTEEAVIEEAVTEEAVTEQVAAACMEQLAAHELIKVKILDGCPTDRKEVAAELEQQTGACIAQILGRTLLLYLPSPDRIIPLP